MARQLEPTNSYSAFFWALIFALAHLHHLVTASAQMPSLTSISPVWPSLRNNKIILNKVVSALYFYHGAHLHLCNTVRMCATALVWRLIFSYQVDPGNQTQVSSLVASTFPCWDTLPIRCAHFLTVLRPSLYSPGWPRTEIHLPQSRIKGMHYHIKSIMHIKSI